MSRTLRMTEAEFANLRRARSASVKQAPRQASTYALKPDFARELAMQIRADKLAEPVLEYAFDKQLDGGGRGWCFDLCWPELRIAIEVDGAVHRIKARFKGDLAKHQAADRLGYRVLRVSPAQVRDCTALDMASKAVSGRVIELMNRGAAKP